MTGVQPTRAEKAAGRRAAVQSGRERCADLAKIIPVELGQWGVLRTRAWAKARAAADRAATLVRVSPERLKMAADRLEGIGRSELDALNEFVNDGSKK